MEIISFRCFVWIFSYVLPKFSSLAVPANGCLMDASNESENATRARDNNPTESRDGGGGGGSSRGGLWRNMQIALAEFMGTGILVFITCMGCTHGMMDNTERGDAGQNRIPNLQLSLISGLAVTAVIQIFAHISGAYVNPAVTICSLIMGQITFTMVPIYVCSQIAGCLTGYGLVVATTPSQHLANGSHCVNLTNDQISVLQAFLVEALVTSVMCLAVCSSWDQRNSTRSDSVPIKIGLVVAVITMAAGTYTGASMNPARSFGPAAWNSNYHNHWVYWAGPVTGASLAGFLYKRIFL